MFVDWLALGYDVRRFQYYYYMVFIPNIIWKSQTRPNVETVQQYYKYRIGHTKQHGIGGCVRIVMEGDARRARSITLIVVWLPPNQEAPSKPRSSLQAEKVRETALVAC